MPASDRIVLVIGLGNPGERYRSTRHNVGADFVELLGRMHQVEFGAERRFGGRSATVRVGGEEVRLFLPATFMNESGRVVGPLIGYFKTPLSQVMIVHDELDLPAGTLRYKHGGGTGGHNGLRDIVASLGNDAGFKRLRIGIGHPGRSDAVVGYVLSRPSPEDRSAINDGVQEAMNSVPLALSGEWQRAVTQLHSIKHVEEPTGSGPDGTQ